MKDWFAGSVAERYDDDAEMFAADAVDPVVDFLAPFAGGGALELGIGTGRIALPLAARGVHVEGIDLSPDMVAKLRSKPGGEAIPVAIGDFSSTVVDGRFSLVYLVFNTIMNLTSQAAQVACFRNAAGHLAPGGAFVVEVGVPDLRRLPPGERFVPFTVKPEHVGVDEYDTVEQGLVSHHYILDGDRAERVSVPFRYVWPAELDLMATLSGLVFRERWENWHRATFAAESREHVSLWQKIG